MAIQPIPEVELLLNLREGGSRAIEPFELSLPSPGAGRGTRCEKKFVRRVWEDHRTGIPSFNHHAPGPPFATAARPPGPPVTTAGAGAPGHAVHRIRPGALCEAALKGHHRRADFRILRHLGRRLRDLFGADPPRNVHASQPDHQVAIRRRAHLQWQGVGEGGDPLRIRHGIQIRLHGGVGERPVGRTGIEVHHAKPPGQQFRHGALPRPGGAVNRHEQRDVSIFHGKKVPGISVCSDSTGYFSRLATYPVLFPERK